MGLFFGKYNTKVKRNMKTINSRVTSDSHLNLLLLVFVFSGFAGLIYQSIWSHYLGLFLGHAAYAQALVLAIFMGGMAGGAWWTSHSGHKWRNLIKIYAVVEVVIGFFALIFHWGFVGLVGVSYSSVIPTIEMPMLVEVYKWSLAVFLILPQTVLLGMTFPLMSGGVIRRFPGSDGKVLGGLYFTNSIGAAVGVLCAVFLIMPLVGLKGAMLTAGVINLVVAGLAWFLSRAPEVYSARPPAQPDEVRAKDPVVLKIVLLATFFSGAASFAYEIIWVRMLSLAVGSTIHAFELMLASFIAGIAFGGLWVRGKADKAKDPIKLVGWLQVLMGLAALASLYFYSSSFGWVSYIMSALSSTDSAYAMYNIGTGFVSILIMMPAAFFAGTTLPLFTLILLRYNHGESSIGKVYAWNTFGAILGVFLAIHVLLPVLGLKLGLVFAAVVDISIGMLLLRFRASVKLDMVKLGLSAVIILVVLHFSILHVNFDPLRLSSGVYRSGVALLPETSKVIYYKDGKTSSIASSLHKGGVATISTNGKPDASIQLNANIPPTTDEPTMVLAAAIPLGYLENARTAAVIGFGSGLSTHTLLANPSLKQVDTIEIERAMVEGARIFGDRVDRAYSDQRSNIVIDDAKSFLSSQQKKYDIIISEPSNPWISGVGALFSKEFYEFVPQFLSEDGIFLQWLQLYEIDEGLVGTVLNALTPNFHDYHAYLSNNSDLLIVASMEDLPKDVDFSNLIAIDMASDLSRVGISDTGQISFRRIADARMIEAWSRLFSTRTNSDYFPILSLEAPRARFQRLSASKITGLQVSEFPVLEYLSISSPLAKKIPTGYPGHLARADNLSLARSVREVLLGNYDNVGEEHLVASEVALEILLLSSCDVADGFSELQYNLLVKRIRWLAQTLLPYLSIEEQQGVFVDPLWGNCFKNSGPSKLLMEFLSLASQRNFNGLIAVGESWFSEYEDREGIYFKEFDYLIYGYLQLAYIAVGEEEMAKNLEERIGFKVPLKNDSGYIRSLILSWLDE